jgi:hypothetical protein
LDPIRRGRAGARNGAGADKPVTLELERFSETTLDSDDLHPRPRSPSTSEAHARPRGTLPRTAGAKARSDRPEDSVSNLLASCPDFIEFDDTPSSIDFLEFDDTPPSSPAATDFPPPRSAPRSAPTGLPDVASLKRLSQTNPRHKDQRPRTAFEIQDRTDEVLQRVVDEYVETGRLPVDNEELALALSRGDAGLFGSLTQDDRRCTVVQCCLDIVNNNLKHPIARAGASAINVTLRDFATVGLTTVMRQLIGHYIDRAPGVNDKAMGFALGALPVVLQAAGQTLDRCKHRTTVVSTTSRAMMVLISVGVLAATAKTGQLDAAAPSMFSFGVYCLVRDMSQRFLQLKDQLPGLDMAATAISAGIYGPNQMALNEAMSVFASPSGAGTESVESTNAVRRGALNWGGEVLDNIVFGAVQAALQNVPFQVRLSPKIPMRDDLWDTFFRQFTARLTLFMAVVQITQVFSAKTEGKLPQATETVLTNLIGAGSLALLYNLFVCSLKTEVHPSSKNDPEGHPAFDSSPVNQTRP